MIKEHRIKTGVTQEKLASLLGVDRSTIAKWETGVASPRADKLVLLAKELRCTVDELLAEQPHVRGTAAGASE